MFTWIKKSQIWTPSLDNAWMKEYGQNPNALVLDDRIRIYFSSRKKNNDDKYISYIFYIDVEKQNPTKIIDIHDKPILNPNGAGEHNSFDEFGTMPGSILWLKDRQEVWMYYVGWQRPASLPYQWANGLAVSTDKGSSFQKISKDPVLSLDYQYPYLQACPRVFRFNDKWLMWYASGVEWYEYKGRQNPIYVLMSAHSQDGVHWKLNHTQSLSPVGKKECQSSASVIELNGLYHMFFSYRDVLGTNEAEKQYRIGYAWSNDLKNWHRDDSQAGIDVSSSGWDSEAICYPHVVTVEDKIFMFYSGNQYGRSGFGYAELAIDP